MFRRPLGDRRRATAFVVTSAALAASVGLPLLGGGIASAGTTSAPLTLGTATAGIVTPAFTGQTTNGLLNGDQVRFRVDANSGQNIFSLQARICQTGSSISNTGDFSPTQGSQCAGGPLAAGTQNVVTVAGNPAGASPANTFAEGVITVGAGSNTFTNQDGNPITITCGPANPCELWLQANMTTGNQYAFFPLTYATNPDTPAAPNPGPPADGSVSVSWSAPANTGNAPITSYSLVPEVDGVAQAPITVTGATSYTMSATNFSSYRFSVAAINGRNLPSAASPFSAAVSPGPAPATNIGAIAGDQSATVSWTPPANTTGLTAYRITPYTGVGFTTAGTPQDFSAPATSANVIGLVNGTPYRFTVSGIYGAGNVGPASTQSPTITPAGKFVTQVLTADRPVGTLEIAEACAGGNPTTAPDPASGLSFGTYPQTCNVNLGTGVLDANATFYVASGNIQTVSVRDLRDTDAGWTVSAQVSNFSSGTDSFSGGCLGFQPAATGLSTTPTYTQTVTGGAAVPANCGAAGLTTSTPVMSAPALAGLGRADLTGPLTLTIPVSADAGTYQATLTFTVL